MSLSDRPEKIDKTAIMELLKKAEKWQAKGEYGKVITILKNEILPLDTTNIFALYNIGLAYSELGQQGEALKYYDEALKNNPGFAMALGGKAILLADMNQLSASKVAFDKLIQIEPHNPARWCDRGILLFKMGHYEDSLSSFVKSLELDASNPDCWVYQGIVLGELKRYGEAKEAYNKALKINPHHYQALNNLKAISEIT